ncbi:GNAT family N-acetyltransferase [Clostridium sp. D2Q-14]|uniref:GNAT family N-acetyltransferase n=1 Tax=Anaeromonas gelatinilytica TaxID=2683194 RepID=UPI00193C3745|nr:GNAT family N-acetyltransferase [Anaeromonas gelatinilytica]MBS4535120.1 GNAT family N-acetyltransferase [Anaeromonas gelatinilytica]
MYKTTYQFESDRLGFRLWNAEDSMLFSRMNADNNVMQYFPNVLSKEESDKFIEKIMNHFEEHGYGLWAVELKVTNKFIGFIGFYTATFEADFTPCIEIGWRLDDRFWNKGYATEGAIKCLEYGFKVLGLNKIYSFTSQLNKPSINVMKKIGLKEQGSFFHPSIEADNPLRLHVLYEIDKKAYDKISSK